MAVGYSGRWDILQAARRTAIILVKKVCRRFGNGGHAAFGFSHSHGRRKTISNFMLWQAAYAELYFTDVLCRIFPMTIYKRHWIVLAGRERRFGSFKPMKKTAARILIALPLLALVLLTLWREDLRLWQAVSFAVVV